MSNGETLTPTQSMDEKKETLKITQDPTQVNKRRSDNYFKEFTDNYMYLKDIKHEILEFDTKSREIIEEDKNPKQIKPQENVEISPFVKECLKFYNGKFTSVNYKENFENLIFTHNVLLDSSNFDLQTKRHRCPPQQFFEQCHRFHLDVGIHEPYFLGLEIIDVFKQKPVTEKFYFHLNSKDIISSYFSDTQALKDLLLKGEEIPKGIFTVGEPNLNMYLLLTVEKVVQGKLENVIQQFKNTKDFKGVKKGDMLNLNFTQQFLWSFSPIFNLDEKNVVLNKGMTFFKYFYPFNMKYTEIYQLIQSHKDGGQIKRLQNIPGYFLIEILAFKPQNFEKDVKERLKFTSSRRNSIDINADNVFECIEQVQKMNKKNLEDITSILEKKEETKVDKKDYINYQYSEYQITSQKTPFFNYLHELIIYPESVNLVNIVPEMFKTLKYRNFNVLLQVKLLSREEKDVELDCFPSKFDKNQLNSYYNTNVLMQNFQPSFTDQIKIILPLPVEKKHCLLFMFYHMSSEKSKDQDSPCTFIGCSTFSLLDIVKYHEGTEQTPVLKKIPLVDETPTPFEKINFFKFSTKLISTIQPKESSLNLFFSNMYKLFELPEDKKKDLKSLKEVLIKSTKDILELRSTQPYTYFTHYPMVLDLLFTNLGIIPELLAYHPETQEEEKKTPRSLDDQRSRLRKLSVKDKIQMFEQPSDQKKPERKGSYVKTESKSSLVKPEITVKTPENPTLTEKSTLGKKTIDLGRRISMKLFGTSFEGNQVVSKSTPVSPLILPGVRMVEEEADSKSFFKVLQEYEKTTFDTILYLLKGTYTENNEYTKPNLLLSSYSQYIFNETQTFKSPLFFVITRSWYKTLENMFGVEETPQPVEEAPLTLRRKQSVIKPGLSTPVPQTPLDPINDSLSFSWFFFELIKKSFVIKKPQDHKAYYRVLRDLISTIGSIIYESKEKKEFTKFLNQQIALFLSDLAYDLKDEYLFDILISYFDAIDQKLMKDLTSDQLVQKKKDVIVEVIHYKLGFLNTFYDHDQIIALHSPCEFKSRAYPPLKLLLSVFKDIHNFEKKVKSLSKDENIDEKKLKEDSHNLYTSFIDFLKYIMTKHETDGRYQKVSQKEILGRIYFPFIILLMNIDFDEVLEKQFIEKFIIFIIKNINNDFFMSWIKSLADDVLLRFLKVLARCMTKFSFDVTNPNEEKKKQSKMLIEVAFNVVVEKFLLIYQLKRTLILKLPKLEDNVHIPDTAYLSQETNLLEVSLYIISLIVKKDNEYNFGYCNKKKGKELHSILKELASIQDKGYGYWKWMYGILLQGITLSIDDLNPYFYDLMLIMEEPITIPDPPKIFFEEDTIDNIDYDKNSLDIKSATVDKLIEKLFALKQNKNYSKQFFLTYRSFTSPFDLLEQLKQRHFEQSHSEIQGLRIFNCLKHWITDYFYDFDNAMIVKLFSFLQLVKNSPASQGIKSKLEKHLLYGDEKESKRIFSTPPPEKILPTITLKPDQFDLTVWSPIEIARQVALIEYKIFCRIQPKECFNLSWTKKNKEITSPNIVELTNRFNNFSYWLATLIVKEEDLKKRQNLVAHIIKLGQCCEQIHNFNAVSTISSALNNAAIFRLKKTFEGIPKDLIQKRIDLSDLVTNTGNYKNLRLALQCHPPCIPYLGVFLTDLTFIEEGSPNIVKDTMVNFNKRRQFAEVLMKINILQQSPYNYSEIKELQHVLIECKEIWDDGPLFKQSLKIEPREKTN